MLVSLDWVNDFVKTPSDLSAKEIGEKLTLSTAEVEEVNEVNAYYKQIKVVEITSIEPHPEADKLNIVTFKVSDKKTFQVVCGASNVKVGLKTPFAPIGTTLPVGFTLEPKKIRGVLSEGMLCSEEELGLADSSAGIMELPASTQIGVTLKELWKKNVDTIFDIDNKSLTHRPDLWGHYGFAREFATIYNTKLVNKYDQKWLDNIKSKIPKTDGPLKVKIESDTSCQSYYGISMEGVHVEESPQWLKDRLIAVGLRPINNLVDASNYVMMELGHPLHVFDRDEISGDTLLIKSADDNSDFTTLDDVSRKLIKTDTVICDNNQALVLAGVMGGLSSGVQDKTKKIFIEVANWKASRVRDTSTRLGLRTDSSARFEKTLDSAQCEHTLVRAIDLILELCPEAKIVGGIQCAEEGRIEDLSIDMSINEIVKTLGKDVSKERIVEILTSLEFGVVQSKESLKVNVPSFRATKDVSLKADIIEEVGRIIGYDNIVSQSPLLDVNPVRLSPAHTFKRKAQDFLSVRANSYEVNTYPMVGEKLLNKMSWDLNSEGLIKILNSLSKDQELMRDSLIPSMLDAVSLNSKTFDRGRFFELGRSYLNDKKNFFNERLQLSMVFFDKDQSTFMPLLNEVVSACDYLNIPNDLSDRHPKFKNNLVSEDWIGLHPFEYKNIRIMGKMNGVLFSVHPLLLKKLKIKGNVSVAVIDYTDVVKKVSKDKTKYKPLSKFPGSRFDFTLTMKQSQSVKEVFDVIKSLKIKELSEYGVVDTYRPDKEEMHVTFMTYFSDSEKTLSGDFIKECESKIVSSLEQKGLLLKTI
jgi:phenylalanyl-tRNA synthetase beta chain